MIRSRPNKSNNIFPSFLTKDLEPNLLIPGKKSTLSGNHSKKIFLAEDTSINPVIKTIKVMDKWRNDQIVFNKLPGKF